MTTCAHVELNGGLFSDSDSDMNASKCKGKVVPVLN